jgi:hypothetical protein
MISRREFIILLPMVPPVCKAMVAHNVEWDQFAVQLGRALRNLHRDQFLIIEKKRDLYYVQFAGGGTLGMCAEAVSNGYLDIKRKLSDQACRRLLQLGWNAPTVIPDPIHDARGYKGYGVPNYFVDVDTPIPSRSLAKMAVKTLREVFEARRPAELQYIAFAKRGGKIGFPTLGIPSVTSASSMPSQSSAS